MDLTFSKVFLPYLKEKILNISPSNALEIGGGTGHLAIEILSLVRNYTYSEPSTEMFSIASELLKGEKVTLIKKSFQELPNFPLYDLILSHMCIQTIDDLSGFFEKIKNLLTKSGFAIITMPHPCFYNDYKKFFSPDEYSYWENLNKVISFSITKDPDNKIVGVPYHHRPLSNYINNIGIKNFRIVSFDEIRPSSSIETLYGSQWSSPRYCSFILQNG